METRELTKIIEETWKFLDTLSPREIAEIIVNADNNARVIYSNYLSEQPSKRSLEVKRLLDKEGYSLDLE